MAFSEKFAIVKNLTHVNDTQLELRIKTSSDDESYHNFTWNATSFASNGMIIQLQFEHPIYISASSVVRDMLIVKVIDSYIF